jgi:hypothetical protein
MSIRTINAAAVGEQLLLDSASVMGESRSINHHHDVDRRLWLVQTSGSGGTSGPRLEPWSQLRVQLLAAAFCFFCSRFVCLRWS